MFRKEIQIEKIDYNGNQRIKLKFDYNPEIIKHIKEIPGARWSATMKCWHVPYNAANYNTIKTIGSQFNLLIKYKTQDIKATNTQISNILVSENDNTFKVVIIELDEYNQLIFLKISYNAELVAAIKKLTGAWWHLGIQKWSVYYDSENLEKIKEIFKDCKVNYIDKKKSVLYKREKYLRDSAPIQLVPEVFINELRMQNKSEHTIRHYTSAIALFMQYFKNKDIGQLSTHEIEEYILRYRYEYQYSPAFQNQVISALKLYYHIVYERDISDKGLARPKRSRQLPKVISREEIEALIGSTLNRKHRLILILMYGCGLRVGEVIKLKVEDIDMNRRQLFVYNAKGRKDRSVNMTEKLIVEIKRYLRDYMPREYLFNGQGNLLYSPESIRNIVHKSAEKAGIRKNVTPHVLRHCYATHMLERGIDLRYIQYLLGHKSSRTTEIYTHVSNYKINELGSPIDDIKLEEEIGNYM
jgi:integrase/recombinase XerD